MIVIPKETVMTNEQRTLAFFARWGVSYGEMTASFREAFAPECLWEQRPLAVTRGLDEAVRFLNRAKLGMGLRTVDVEIRTISSSGCVIFTERVDHLRGTDGALIVSAPVVGVMEWRDGQIAAWREYFDSASFVARALPRLVTRAARRATRRSTRSAHP